jgi:MerR family transcriptional regulator/heat shock protein HspR
MARNASRNGPGSPSPNAPVYVISVAAELTGLHPQTLRQYDRVGLVSPGRTGGGGRRYSLNDIEMLRVVAELTAAGIGLEGVRRILALENQVAALRSRNAELQSQVRELRAALDAAVSALAEHRPNLPVLRPRGTIRPFGQPWGHPFG